jgi:SAM-dependent methyltransferase
VDIVQTDIQLTCAKYLRWLVDEVTLTETELTISGWAIAYGHDARSLRFLVNGNSFATVEWPLPSAYLLETFSGIPQAANAGFVCRQPFNRFDDVFVDGFARFDLVTTLVEHSRSYRHAWYYPDPRGAAPLPEDRRITRVIGTPHRSSYLLGGATTVKRYEAYLRERFSRSYSDFSRILDWGCGSARVTRCLVRFPGPTIFGGDIDADNIGWCRQHIPSGEFHVLPLRPPTKFTNAQFDLVIGTSVFTHLAEDVQFAWLEELQRITVSGAILLLSISGLSQMALLGVSPKQYLDIEREGFYLYSARNAQLEGLIGEDDYYKDVAHSRDYIFAQWGLFFDVVDIIDSLAANQDLVVLRRR